MYYEKYINFIQRFIVSDNFISRTNLETEACNEYNYVCFLVFPWSNNSFRSISRIESITVENISLRAIKFPSSTLRCELKSTRMKRGINSTRAMNYLISRIKSLFSEKCSIFHDIFKRYYPESIMLEY